ncbi:MAG: KTSC domain-containing protein [Alphaproteobacteria bacterium]|nr:KTSC domain-containing protein [Alphaproteobacteria bacterium]
MRRHRVASTSIRSAGYDARTRTLEIEFIDGQVYRYLDVANGVYRQLMSARSKGQFVNSQIRDVYRYRDSNGFSAAAYADTAPRDIPEDRRH